MEPKLVIRTETPPERCDICHQSDLFDPLSGQCARCKNIPEEMVKMEPARSVVAPPERCNICRQSDLFDPLSGQCARCNNTSFATAKTEPSTAKSIPKKKSDYLFLSSLLAFVLFTGKNLTVSRALMGVTFAIVAATYLYQRYGPDKPIEDEEPEGSKRVNKMTEARWGIIWTGGVFATFANLFEREFNFNLVTAICFFAAMAIDNWNLLYKAKTLKNRIDGDAYFRSDVILKFVQGLLMTTSFVFSIPGLITSGYTFWAVFFSILTGIGSLNYWLDWNKARKHNDQTEMNQLNQTAGD